MNQISISVTFWVIFFFVFISNVSQAQDSNQNDHEHLNNVKITTSDSTICEGESTILEIDFPEPDSSNTIEEKIRSWLYSGLGDWEYTENYDLITNYSNTYGLPGMMIYGDSTQSYGAIEAEIRQTNVGPQANAGIAMAVNENNYNDEYPYNGPGCYFLAISQGKVELYNGTWNTPMNYADGPVSSESVPGLETNEWNKVKLEILPNFHVYGYVNDSLYIDYEIPNGNVPHGYFALVTSNSHNEYKSVSSYYFPLDILWSTGDTTKTISVEPIRTKDYSLILTGYTTTWTDTITVEVNPIANVVEYISICGGESYKDWSETGQYVSTLESVSGCDSIVTTVLTVNQNYTLTEDITICEGDSYKSWTTEGQHRDTMTTANGCDSVVITNLSFYQTGSATFDCTVS